MIDSCGFSGIVKASRSENRNFGKIMKTQNTITTLILATLLTGCGVKNEDHQRVLTEIQETRQALEQSQSEVSTLKEKLTSAEAEVDRLRKQDTYAFTQAGRLLDSGDLDGARRAFKAFVRDFPSSPQIDNAKSQVSLIEQELDVQRHKAADFAEEQSKEQARVEMERKLRSGELTLPEWENTLRGKSMPEVIALVGRPDANIRENTTWLYLGMVYDPILDKKRTLVVVFDSSGRFKRVEYTL
jgi:hypothetical protein